jgi:hypothetical protein
MDIYFWKTSHRIYPVNLDMASNNTLEAAIILETLGEFHLGNEDDSNNQPESSQMCVAESIV